MSGFAALRKRTVKLPRRNMDRAYSVGFQIAIAHKFIQRGRQPFFELRDVPARARNAQVLMAEFENVDLEAALAIELLIEIAEKLPGDRRRKAEVALRVQPLYISGLQAVEDVPVPSDERLERQPVRIGGAVVRHIP